MFAEEVDQTDLFRSVGLPLVDDLIKGRNGLLFTYGITGMLKERERRVDEEKIEKEEESGRKKWLRPSNGQLY